MAGRVPTVSRVVGAGVTMRPVVSGRTAVESVRRSVALSDRSIALYAADVVSRTVIVSRRADTG